MITIDLVVSFKRRVQMIKFKIQYKLNITITEHLTYRWRYRQKQLRQIGKERAESLEFHQIAKKSPKPA